MKLLLQGYYGFGNLGDDLLLRISYKLIKEAFPKASVHIFSNGNQPGYIFRIIGTETTIINYNHRHHYQIIVHGGGGVHFDYRKGGKFYLLKNLMARLFGIHRSIMLIKKVKQILRKKGISTSSRFGIGIGIGKFTNSSKKYLYNMEVITEYDYLFVRDRESLKNLTKYPFKGKVELASDLIFLDKTLSISKDRRNAELNSRKIGVILRDWPYDQNHHIDHILKALGPLQEKFEFTFISFDKKDAYYKNKIRHNFYEYDPAVNDINEFIKILNEQALIITSRAHGAYLSCCLGLPSICINIEPKLSTVNNALPNSSVLIDQNIESKELEMIIIKIFDNYHFYLQQAELDLDQNKLLANRIIRFLTKIGDHESGQK